MSIQTVMWVFFGFLFVATIVLVLVLRAKAYRNKAWIARQAGTDASDVVWVEDRYLVKNINGLWVIKFKRLREMTGSVDGKYTTKFVRSTPKMLRYTAAEWKALDLSKKLQRGIFFYETTEGEFYPMSINDDKKTFSRIDTNTRMFLIKSTQDANSLTKNRRHEFMVLGGIIAGCIVLGLIFIFGTIYMHNQTIASIEASKAACYTASQAAVNGTTNQFLGSVQGVLGG